MNALRIVAVGGGEIGRPGYPVETTDIDREAVSLTDTSRPRLTFLPTATRDSPVYVDAVQKHFGDRLGCEVTPIALYADQRSSAELRDVLLSSDIIYVGGGNTRSMLAKWFEADLDLILMEAAYRGIVIAGLSAGAICWFEYGLSDSVGPGPDGQAMGLLGGLGLLPFVVVPHYCPEILNLVYFPAVAARTGLPIICLSNCAALIITEGTWQVAVSRREAFAELFRVEAGSSARHRLQPGIRHPLEELIATGP